jgi:starch phosphorylase
MKAALNGVPSLSILDGWWIEGCAENTTGWAIENGETEEVEANSLYNKLEKVVAPLWASPNAWARLQQHCIGINGAFFNTQRMLSQYLANAYFPVAANTEQLGLTGSPSEDVGLHEPAFIRAH